MKFIHYFGSLLLIVALGLFYIPEASADEFNAARESLLNEIIQDVKRTGFLTSKTQLDKRVVQALKQVPRHKFVRSGDEDHAYENRPLPIGHGQTISQPYIVAIMTELLDVTENDKILEVGTGSGYQAAVLAVITKSVFTIEIIEPLANQAKERLRRLNYNNVQVKLADGYYGWEDQAPFDGIIVTAAPTQIPPSLIQQLKPGGKMVIPVGSQFFTQQLMVVEKLDNGKVRTRSVLPVSFVPLTGSH